MNNIFVSRGGIKLQYAIQVFNLDIYNKVALDVGSSTGGFVDCLLQYGVNKVYAVDTAYGELAWKIRNNSKVVVMERTNILYVDSLPERVDIITIDSGWTKLEKVLPIVIRFLKKDGVIIGLLKPQYEIDKSKLIKGLVPTNLTNNVKDLTLEKIKNMGVHIVGSIDSPILGGGGNKEFLVKMYI